MLKATWKNNRCRYGRVEKRLDRFLVIERIVENHHFIRQWVGKSGLSDHFPIFLEFKNAPVKPPSPLKFNKIWLKDESFIDLITNGWAHYELGNRNSAAFQFAENFRNLKEVIKAWAVENERVMPENFNRLNWSYL